LFPAGFDSNDLNQKAPFSDASNSHRAPVRSLSPSRSSHLSADHTVASKAFRDSTFESAFAFSFLAQMRTRFQEYGMQASFGVCLETLLQIAARMFLHSRSKCSSRSGQWCSKHCYPHRRRAARVDCPDHHFTRDQRPTGNARSRAVCSSSDSSGNA
jgi:hypothetical protein